jgi:integrase
VVKTRRRRELVLLDQTEQLLMERRERLKQEGHEPTGYVFPLPAKDAAGVLRAGHGSNPQKAEKFSQRFRRLFLRCVAKGLIEKEKGGERLVPYLTRHSRITELFTAGHDHAVVMFEAGHTNPSTTERYKHLAASHVADAIRGKAGLPS